MDVEVIEERENPLLNRREIVFRIRFSGPTPSRGEVRDKLIAALDSDKKLSILDSYVTEFGTNIVKGVMKVYYDLDSMKVEPRHKLAKNFPEAATEGAVKEGVKEKSAGKEVPKDAGEGAVKEGVKEKSAEEEVPKDATEGVKEKSAEEKVD